MNKEWEEVKLFHEKFNHPIGQYPKQGWSGSTVPVLENIITEYEEMISKLEGVDYIEHRIYCKKCIDYIREEIKSTISKEFVYDY